MWCSLENSFHFCFKKNVGRKTSISLWWLRLHPRLCCQCQGSWLASVKIWFTKRGSKSDQYVKWGVGGRWGAGAKAQKGRRRSLSGLRRCSASSVTLQVYKIISGAWCPALPSTLVFPGLRRTQLGALNSLMDMEKKKKRKEWKWIKNSTGRRYDSPTPLLNGILWEQPSSNKDWM